MKSAYSKAYPHVPEQVRVGFLSFIPARSTERSATAVFYASAGQMGSAGAVDTNGGRGAPAAEFFRATASGTRSRNMSRRWNLWVAAFLMTLALLLPAAAARAEDPAEGEAAPEEPARVETPLEMAQNYTALLAQGEAGMALDRYWDMDALVKSAFGASLDKQTPEQFEEIKQLLRDHIQRHNGSPRNLWVLRNSKFEDFRVRERSGTPRSAMITYSLVIAKTERVLMTLIVREDGDSWRIIDGGVMGKMMVAQMRSEYRNKAKGMTPLEYVHAMIKAVDARSNEAAVLPQ
jgi:hypothetical protein